MQFATFWAAFYNSLFAELLLMTLKPFTNQDNTFACYCHQRAVSYTFSVLEYTCYLLHGQQCLNPFQEQEVEHNIIVYITFYLFKKTPRKKVTFDLKKK